ncbi:MAG: DJ-1 family protein [Phycisphaerae bacterium]|nr:DJ-1 family protein [Phycisphaerae bacterium]
MAQTILIAIADGTEELEAITLIDVLRRAGANVTVASVGDLQVTTSHGVKLTADVTIADCRGREYDCIVLPGGMPGAEHLRDSTPLVELLKTQKQRGGWYAAICAAPAVVLAHHGLLGKKATCYPSFADRLPDQSMAHHRVVVDGRCITSQGPGTALEFALELVRRVICPDQTQHVAAAMLTKP